MAYKDLGTLVDTYHVVVFMHHPYKSHPFLNNKSPWVEAPIAVFPNGVIWQTQLNDKGEAYFDVTGAQVDAVLGSTHFMVTDQTKYTLYGIGRIICMLRSRKEDVENTENHSYTLEEILEAFNTAANGG